MSESVISIFHCSPAADGAIITVRGSGRSRYRYVERAARRLVRWITVTASWIRRAVVCFGRPLAVSAPYRVCVLAHAGGLRL